MSVVLFVIEYPKIFITKWVNEYHGHCRTYTIIPKASLLYVVVVYHLFLWPTQCNAISPYTLSQLLYVKSSSLDWCKLTKEVTQGTCFKQMVFDRGGCNYLNAYKPSTYRHSTERNHAVYIAAKTTLLYGILKLRNLSPIRKFID